MLSGLDSFAQDPKTGLYSPIISRRQVLPYDDVDALGWGSTPAQISPDLLSAFAVLVGQSGQQGKLIHATQYGFLETAAQVNYSAKAGAAAAPGALSIRIDDPVFGASDTPLWIFPGPTNPNPTHGPYFVNAESDPHVLDLNTGLLIQVEPGDVLMAVPQVQLLGSGNRVTMVNAAPAPWQVPALGTSIHLTTKVDPLADTVIAGVTGKAIRLHGWSLSSDVSPNSVYLRTATLGRFAETRFLNAVGTDTHNWHDFHGRPLPTGEAVTISADAAGFVSGTLDYSFDPP